VSGTALVRGLMPRGPMSVSHSAVLGKHGPFKSFTYRNGFRYCHAEVVGQLCQRTLLCVDYTVCTVHQYFKQ